MKRLVILQTPRFDLVSWGNGAAYCLRRKTDLRTIFFQGEDAGLFRDELDTMEKVWPHRPTDELLALLWDQYEPAAILEDA